jgi:Retrotransposon gag protein
MNTIKKDAKNTVVEINTKALNSELLDTKRESRSAATNEFYAFEDKPKVVKARAGSDSTPIDNRRKNPANISVAAPQPAQAAPVQQLEIIQAPAPPVAQQPVINQPVQQTDEDMADGVSVPMFFGNIGEDATLWLNSLRDFIDFKTIAADKKLSLFKLRLAGSAQTWMTALPDDQKDTFEHLAAAFLLRFLPKELEKFRYAKELFNEKQMPGQSVDDFISQIRKKGSIAGVDETTLAFIIINALSPNISSYVLEHEHETIEKILQHARVAELTRSAAPLCTNNTVAQQISTLTEQVTRLNQKIANLSVAALDENPMKRQVSFEDVRARPQSPMIRRDRSGDRERDKSPYQRAQYGETRERSNYRPQNNPASNGQSFNRPSYQEYRQPEQRFDYKRSNYQPGPRETDRNVGPNASNANTCTTCGYKAHINPLYCPLLDKRCFKCDARGHGARVCQAREKRF